MTLINAYDSKTWDLLYTLGSTGTEAEAQDWIARHYDEHRRIGENLVAEQADEQ